MQGSPRPPKMSKVGRKYNHEMKIITGWSNQSIETKYKEYMDSIQDKYGDAFNADKWVKFFTHYNSPGTPLIYLFIFIEDYMNEEEYEEFKKKT